MILCVHCTTVHAYTVCFGCVTKDRGIQGEREREGCENIRKCSTTHHRANDDNDVVKLFKQNAQIRTVSGTKIEIIDREKGLFLVH